MKSPVPSLSLCLAALGLVYALMRPTPAFAHAVYIFAWAEDGSLCSESYFSKKSKVRGGRVELFDAQKKLLHTGLTDEAGRVCFDAPPTAQDVTFVINAGEGHRAEFVLPASHMAEVLPPPAPQAGTDVGSRPASPTPERAPGQANTPGPVNTPGPANTSGPVNTPGQARPGLVGDAAVLESTLRAIVRDELRRELAPLYKAQAQAASGPSVRDILGGLGWIIGLAGIGAWFARRRSEV